MPLLRTVLTPCLVRIACYFTTFFELPLVRGSAWSASHGRGHRFEPCSAHSQKPPVSGDFCRFTDR